MRAGTPGSQAMRSGRRSRLVGTFAFVALVIGSAVRAEESFDALLANGEFGAAQALAQQHLAAAERASPAGSPAVADALVQLARVALERNRPDTAQLEAWLARALELRTASAGAQSAGSAEVKMLQARRLLRLDRADPALELATTLHAQAQGAGWPRLLETRSVLLLATIQNQRADAKAALEWATLAEDQARAQPDAPADVLIDALDEHAFALIRMRKGEQAAVPAAEADRLVSERLGARSRRRADALRIVAYARRDQGDFGGAIDALEQALEVQRAQSEVDQRQVSLLLLNLGQTLKISGKGDAALKRYEQALANDARFPDASGRNRASILHGLANLYRDSNDSRRAVDLYAQALPLFEHVYGAGSTQLAQVINNYANARANLAEYDAAVALYEQALAIARKRDSRDPADYTPQSNLGMVKVWQGRYAEAEPDFREMLERLRGVAVSSEAGVLFAQLGLAASLWGQNRLDDAFAAAQGAETMRQSGLRLAAAHMGEEHAISFQEYLRPTLDFVLAIAIASGKPEHLERAWELSMAARDEVTSIVAQRLAAARAAHDAVVAPLWKAWRDASAEVARAGLAGDAGQRQLEARETLDRADRALGAATSPLSAALDAAPLRFAALRGGVPEDTALVLFATLQPRVASDFAKTEAEQRSPELYAFVLPARDGAVHALRLGTLDDATRLIDSWSAALSDRDVARAAVAARGRAVRAKLWDPLAALVPGKRVFVLPQGSLFRVPWPALPDKSGFLLDAGYAFHVLDHERELLLPELANGASQRLLAVADPALGARAAAGTSRACPAEAALTALPGARSEVKRIDTLWRAHFPASEATVLEGADATEARVRGASARTDVLHFATHGISVAGTCAPDGTRGFSLAAETPVADAAAPAFASAALALAAGDGVHTDDDGVLSAEEIAALDLSRVRWAVLAACSTAAGVTHHYEGLFGLARAFRLAGARTVITSLWPVDDAATAAWTQALYEARLERHLDSAMAARDAQRSVLAARRSRGESEHPYYWAGFVASGDWR